MGIPQQHETISSGANWPWISEAEFLLEKKNFIDIIHKAAI